MPSRTTLLIGSGFAIATAVIGYAVFSRDASARIDPARLATAEVGTIARSVVATGRIEPVAKVEIKSKANGIIERLLVDVDQPVQAGQVLAELDRLALRARVREAEANLEAAGAALSAAEALAARHEVEAEAPDVALAAAGYERAKALAGQALLSTEALEQARTQHDQAINRQRAARSQLQVSRARIEEARAQVAQARAAAERSGEELANATIRSPIEGTVLARDVELGSPVSSILNLGANATPVMTVGDLRRVFVRGKVDEADIGQVHLGQPARITTESFRAQVFTGQVTSIAPLGIEKDNVTTFTVEVSVDNPGQMLRAGMTANAEIVMEERTGVLLIPESAVQYDAERRAFVDLADAAQPGGRRRVPVQTGIGNGTRTQVLQGLKPGDRVVLPG